MTIQPQATIAPGETTTMQLSLRDDVWRDGRIMDIQKPSLAIAGLLLFKDVDGRENHATIHARVTPKLY
jgi:hypothetical protein